MSQNDYSIADQDGQSFLNDLNDALQADQTQNAGSSAPITTYPNQWWVDDTNNLLKIRNKANSAWVTVASWDGASWIPYRDGSELGTAATSDASDFISNPVAADIIPDADSTRDLGSASAAWAETHADKVLTNTLEDAGTGNSDAVQDVIDGRAKAYVSSNSDGTTTRASFNISSMTDRGTGALDANLSVTFADRPTKLCSCGSGNVRIGQETGAGLLDEVEMRTYDDTGSPSDSGDNHIVCHGDLA